MFSLKKPTQTAPELLVDIGSGSVGVALLAPQVGATDKKQSPCIWSDRISVNITSQDATDRLLAKIKTTLLEAILLVNSEGRSALEAAGIQTPISVLHISIAAPWATTVPRHITYGKDEPFICDDALLAKLQEKAETDVKTELEQQGVLDSHDYRVLNSEITQIELNGYPRRYTGAIKAVTLQSLAFTHCVSFVSTSLYEAVMELIEDNFPRVEYTIQPFLSVFTDMALRTTDTASFTLFDITNEATEIGIVRDKVLTAVTHIPHGTHSVARALATKLKTPEDTAIHKLQQAAKTDNKLTESNKAAIQKVTTQYQDELTKSLQQIPDNLAVPALFYTHADKQFEAYFQRMIAKALTDNLKGAVSPRASSYTKLIDSNMPYACDSALSLLCFHILERYKADNIAESTN